MKYRILLILFLFFGYVANAQIPNQEVVADISVFPQEKVELSINSNLLLAGEILQYKGFVLNKANKPSELSKMLYVSMRNEQDSIIFKHKLKVENGTANGDYFIPSTLETGIYRLIGYTNASRNNPQHSFTQQTLYVINTFVKPEIVAKTADTLQIKALPNKKISDFVTDNNSDLVRINSDKKTYNFRDKVNLNIENSSEMMEGNFVLSVRKINPVEILADARTSQQTLASKNFYIPELRGELISGVVLSKSDNKPAVNKTVSLTIPGKNYVSKIANTNVNGRFFFSVTEGYNAEESIVQLIEDKMNAADFLLQLDRKELELEKKTPTFLKLEPSLGEWLAQRSVQLQIENAYFDIKKDSILDNRINPAFYNNLGTLFVLDDYTRFPSVRETFVEVVTPAAVRGSGDDIRLSVYNAYDPNRLAKFNDLPPLVLMDGMLVQNNSDVLNYNAREIKSIRVIAQAYRYGSKIYSGIIAVETKTGSYMPRLSKDYIEKIKLPPAVKIKRIYRADYSVGSSFARIPDYRVQLLWEPKLMLTENNLSTSFYTSDVSGLYEILLEGFTKDGAEIKNKSYFTVEEN